MIAKQVGVDQMLVLTPYFDSLKFDDVRRFLGKVVEIAHAGGGIVSTIFSCCAPADASQYGMT